jgi:hypothetical protein
LLGAVIHPRRTFTELLADPRRLTHGTLAFLLIGLLYTLTVMGLAAAGVNPAVEPWLNIPADVYYFWEIFFALPVFGLGWILAAGVVQLTSRLFGGGGTFEETLAVLGFAIALPSLVTWIPETVWTAQFLTGALSEAEWRALIARPGLMQLFQALYQYVALAWYLLLFTIAAAVVQKLRWWQALLVAIPALAVTGVVMVTFIR